MPQSFKKTTSILNFHPGKSAAFLLSRQKARIQVEASPCKPWRHAFWLARKALSGQHSGRSDSAASGGSKPLDCRTLLLGVLEHGKNVLLKENRQYETGSALLKGNDIEISSIPGEDTT